MSGLPRRKGVSRVTEKEVKIMLDMAAFISYSILSDQPFTWAMLQLSHDCNGLLYSEPCFLPRTTDYLEKLAAFLPKKDGD